MIQIRIFLGGFRNMHEKSKNKTESSLTFLCTKPSTKSLNSYKNSFLSLFGIKSSFRRSAVQLTLLSIFKWIKYCYILVLLIVKETEMAVSRLDI